MWGWTKKFWPTGPCGKVVSTSECGLDPLEGCGLLCIFGCMCAHFAGGSTHNTFINNLLWHVVCILFSFTWGLISRPLSLSCSLFFCAKVHKLQLMWSYSTNSPSALVKTLFVAMENTHTGWASVPRISASLPTRPSRLTWLMPESIQHNKQWSTVQ